MVEVTAERIAPEEHLPGDIPSPEETERQARRDVEDGKPVGDARVVVPVDPVVPAERVIEVRP